MRENIPVENILRAYMDETTETDTEVKIVDEEIPIPIAEQPVIVEAPTPAPAISAPAIIPPIANPEKLKIQFSDIDNTIDNVGNRSTVSAPKTIERLNQLSIEKEKNIQYKDDNDEEYEKLTIGENVNLDIFDINNLDSMNLREPPILDDIEILS